MRPVGDPTGPSAANRLTASFLPHQDEGNHEDLRRLSLARFSLGPFCFMCLAVPGEVLRVYEKHELAYAEVSFGGATREVCLHCHPDTAVGDFVLVHVGFAIARIDRDEAARTWNLLRDLGQEDEARNGGGG